MLVLGDLVRMLGWVQSSRRTLFGRRFVLFFGSLMPGDISCQDKQACDVSPVLLERHLETKFQLFVPMRQQFGAEWFQTCSLEHQSSRKLRTVLFHHRTKLFANPPIWPPFKQYDIVVDVETNQESPCISLKH